MKIYKIRRKSDGLYSNAGSAGPWVGFSKLGKSWHHLRHVIMHMRGVAEASVHHNKPNPYTATCEVVEFDLVERSIIMVFGRKGKKND